MSGDVVLRKVASIDRCIRRAREEYAAAGEGFRDDFTRQDAVVLNLIRACEQAIDVAQIAVRRLNIPRPGSNRELFTALGRDGVVDRELARALEGMVGFRNVAVHEYRDLDLATVEAVVSDHVEQLQRFALAILNALADADGPA